MKNKVSNASWFSASIFMQYQISVFTEVFTCWRRRGHSTDFVRKKLD